MFWLGKTIDANTELNGKKAAINLSPLEVLILAQLRSRELRDNKLNLGQYGYSMIQELNELFAGSWKAQSGTIYPILSKLENKKHLIQGEKRNSPLGPVKKVYILTQLGREVIDRVIATNFHGDIEFISRYLKLITPFTLLDLLSQNDIAKINLNNLDLQEIDQILGSIINIPVKMVENMMNGAVTENDFLLRKRQLEILRNSLQKILDEIVTLSDS